MKKLLISLSLLFATQALVAQNYYVELGLGVGSASVGNDRQGKIMLQAAAMKQLSHQFHLGIELTTGGNFIPSEDNTFEGTTEIYNPDGTNWSSAMLKAKFFPVENLPIYAGLGVGINSYWSNVNTVEAQRTSQINMAMSPEIGFRFLDRVNLGVRYHIGGNTDEFEGNRAPEYGGHLVRLNGESVNILLVTMSWRFGL